MRGLVTSGLIQGLFLEACELVGGDSATKKTQAADEQPGDSTQQQPVQPEAPHREARTPVGEGVSRVVRQARPGRRGLQERRADPQGKGVGQPAPGGADPRGQAQPEPQPEERHIPALRAFEQEGPSRSRLPLQDQGPVQHLRKRAGSPGTVSVVPASSGRGRPVRSVSGDEEAG